MGQQQEKKKTAKRPRTHRPESLTARNKIKRLRLEARTAERKLVKLVRRKDIKKGDERFTRLERHIDDCRRQAHEMSRGA